MRDPEDREIHACKTCRDCKHVYHGPATIDCPECSSWPPEKRAEMMKEAVKREAEKPSITDADLTEDEKTLMADWTLAHPHVHRLTLLTWIEGRRYNPREDEEFLAEARKRYRKWKFLRNTNEGIIPCWARTALETGDLSGLSNADIEYVESLR